MDARSELQIRETILKELESRIPALPEVIRNLLNINYYAETPVTKIAEEIAKDPNLAGEIMRFANSRLFSVLKVTSLEHAIVVLGVHSVSRIALAFWVKRLEESKDLVGYVQKKRDIALQSFVGAYASKRIADITDPFLSTQAFASAAIRSVGRLVIDLHVYAQRNNIIQQVYSGHDPQTAEEKLLGISFPEATYIICKIWNLPDDIKIPCRYFKNPDSLPQNIHPVIKKLTHIVHVGDIIAQMTGAGAGFDNMIERFSKRSLQVLKIDERIIEDIFYETFLRTERIVEEFFGENL